MGRVFDNGIVDGLVNLMGNVVYGVGGWLANVQTGYLRSYVLFLVLAAVAIFMVLAYFVRMACWLDSCSVLRAQRAVFRATH